MKKNKISTAAIIACGFALSCAPLYALSSGYSGERDTENRFHGWGAYTYLAGGKYEGEWQYGQKDGVGRRDWPDGSRYEGEWHNNLPHGKGIKTFKGGAQYTGDFRQGKRDGKGTMRWTNGVEYTGEWKNDQGDGEGSKKFGDGTQYDGHFSQGMRNGWGTYVYADKTRYEGNWVNDMQDGKGTLHFPDGGLYKGEFKQSQPNGHGELTYANGDHYAGQWQQGNLSGKGTLRYAAGGSYEGQWHRGQRHGEGKWVSASGSVYAGPFLGDQPHGKGTCTDSGKSTPCRYEFGRRQESPAAVVAEKTPKTLPAMMPTPVPVKTTLMAVAALTPNTEKQAVFKQTVETAKKALALSPTEQLSKFGSGLFFSHNFPKLPLAEPPSFSWWSKTSAMFSDNIKLTVVRGKEQLELAIASYKGPGVYAADQYSAKLIKDGRVYESLGNSDDNIRIEQDENGWLSGQFSTTLLDKGNARTDVQRLESGVFRLENKKPAAANALTDATLQKKPLLESVAPLFKSFLPN